jgi:hypothetical protein
MSHVYVTTGLTDPNRFENDLLVVVSLETDRGFQTA